MASFRWTKARERAAVLVADDGLSNERIAATVGVSRQGLDLWIAHPTFRERVERHLAAFRERVLAEGIANRQNRVDALNDRWRRMHQVIAERQESHPLEPEAAPGAGTGLMVRQEKQIGAGNNAVRVVEWRVDDGLLSELRAHEKQAAQELGQWTEKKDVTSDGKALTFTLRIDRGDQGESDETHAV